MEIVVEGDRAISQNKMTITSRGDLDGTLCDVTCMGRHLDRWEKRDGLWGLLSRQTIYDRDRVDSVVPGEVPPLDQTLLMSYGEAYRHLAYLLVRRGFQVSASDAFGRQGRYGMSHSTASRPNYRSAA